MSLSHATMKFLGLGTIAALITSTTYGIGAPNAVAVFNAVADTVTSMPSLTVMPRLKKAVNDNTVSHTAS